MTRTFRNMATGWRPMAALLVLFLIGATSSHRQLAWAQEAKPVFQLIVHPDVGLSTVEQAVLADIFLKQRTAWPDGSLAYPVDQLPSASVRAQFSNQVIHRSVQAVRSYWQQRIFSGRGVPPPELESDDAVLAYVKGRSGAVGYVSGRAQVSGVKVITCH